MPRAGFAPCEILLGSCSAFAVFVIRENGAKSTASAATGAAFHLTVYHSLPANGGAKMPIKTFCRHIP